MAKCVRHFRALMRKNFILWSRTYFCSCFEIVTPILLMLVLWAIRLQVPQISVDQEGLLEKKHLSYPSVPKWDGVWYDGSSHYAWLNDKMKNLVDYANYTTRHMIDHNQTYEAEYDWYGPMYWGPGHCIGRFDFSRPKCSSPQLAIVGAQTNITDEMSQLYLALSRNQKDTKATFALPAYQVVQYEDEQALNDYISSPEYKTGCKGRKVDTKGVCWGLQHHVEEDQAPNNYTFSFHWPDKRIGFAKISYNQAIPDQTNPVWLPYIATPDIFSYFHYQHQGYTFMDTNVATQVLMNSMGNQNAFFGMMLQPLPTETSITDPFSIALRSLLPLFLLIIYIPSVYNMTFKIVREKETRAKETMRIMGMTDLPYWLSWFMFYTTINTVVTTLAWGVLMINVINFSNPFYIWIFFWLYGQAVFGQIVFLQSMFTGSKYAGIVATVVYFCGVLMNTLVNNDDTTRAQKLGGSILPQVALMQGSDVFANYEGTGTGINALTGSVLYENYSFDTALWMLLFDFVLFFSLGLYLDKVIPQDFGQRLNPCFCFMPSYYRCCRRQRRRGAVQSEEAENLIDNIMRSQDHNDDEFESNQMPKDNYEAPPVICQRLEASNDYLKIHNLKKTFSSGFQAVKGVSIKMYESQIFALLGHNGAGKSTTISMLTGLIEKSSGEAACYDVNLFDEMDEVREFMGVCPQHDVLFDLLTPREHLDIFYDFKGGDPKRKKAEINSLIEDVGLSIDQNKRAKTLSGGNKRKLSVSIALCGGSKLVMLDEPTSGMDLGARRNLWDMLKSYKKDRIIILTTHYMDEADVLGDRIGIMCKGTLQCIGSPLFLKNRFGVGYKLTFVKKRRESHPQLSKFLHSYFRGVKKLSEVQGEVSYVVPKSETENFASFFSQLDQRLDDFDVSSYGVSMSNLEDVFLKINQEFAPDLFGDLKAVVNDDGKVSPEQPKKYALSQSTEAYYSTDSAHDTTERQSEHHLGKEVQEPASVDADENLIRGSSCVRSCTASSAKRLIMYKRDICGILCQIVIPLILVLFGLWLASMPSTLQQSPPRNLSTGWYEGPSRIKLNSMPVDMVGDGGDVSGEEIAAMFPNSTDFTFTYSDGLNYTEFYEAVYEARNDEPLYPYSYGSFQIYHANRNDSLYTFTAYLNVTSQDVTGMYPHFMMNAMLRAATNDPDFIYDVTTKPFPIYQFQKNKEEAGNAYDFVVMAAIAMAMIPCVMVQFILNERENQLKHQQLLSGMSLAGYWASNMIFDIFMAYIPIILIILLSFLFNQQYQGVWALFLLYPPAIVPFTYVMSFMFTSDINAQIMTLFLHFLTGGLCSILVFALQQIPITMPWGDGLRWAFTLFPSFCVTNGILFSSSGILILDARIQDESESGVIIKNKWPEEIWNWYNLKGDAVILILHFVVGCLVLILIELDVGRLLNWMPRFGIECRCKKQKKGPGMIKDDDVEAEEERVANQVNQKSSQVGGEKHTDCIRVHEFQKEYYQTFGAPIKAVEKASFGLDYGECFALLGVNGAGKSTTFKSLTSEIAPTTGEITIQGYNMQTQFEEARKLIGYCPQYDAIFPKLTVEETIKFYALIKGIRTKDLEGVVEKAIKDLNLKDHRHKLAGTLSGGNKRKLSVAMALLGNPPIILLDEPSAGMDPEARRFMWQVVEKISQKDKKSAVILTTHSMEEAEALSTKLGIMVRGGVFRCMGSSQHIKNKFGVGYEVEVKVQKSQYHELEQMAQQLGLRESELQAKVALDEAIEQCRASQFDELILSHIKADGLGADLVAEAEQENGEVRLRNFVEFLRAQKFGFQIIHYLTRHFDQVEILEQCGEFFKLRVPKQGKTIGWLFGRLESEKGNLGIQEYSVSQTTLEQIFQSFANQSIASDLNAFTYVPRGNGMALVNPDREMTESQLHYSRRGYSVHSEEEKQGAENGQLLLQPVIEEEKDVIIRDGKPSNEEALASGMNDQHQLQPSNDSAENDKSDKHLSIGGPEAADGLGLPAADGTDSSNHE